MGPLNQLLEMMPGGMGQMARQIDPKDAEKQLKYTEAIISSMTPLERRRPDVLNANRRRRIARGSGTDVQDVNRLIKQYREAQRSSKRLRNLASVVCRACLVRRCLPPLPGWEPAHAPSACSQAGWMPGN